MSDSEKDISKKLSFRRIIVPVLLGLGAATYLLISNLNQTRFEETSPAKGEYIWFDENGNGVVDKTEEEEFLKVELGKGQYRKITYQDALKAINWNWTSGLWLSIALLAMAARDLGYMYRIRVLCDKALSWRQSFDVIMLWEFASALTPSVVGGSGIALFIVSREGISIGKSTAIVMVTALLDELFYLVMVPAILIFIGTKHLFPMEMEYSIIGLTLNTEGLFWAGYFFIFILTSIIVTAVFFRPRTFKYILLRIFKLRFLSKWRYKVIKIGDDIILTSVELKGKSLKFWIKSFAATFLSWTARYWVTNFMLLALFPVSDHLLVYARQLVMWVIMLISPTPGGSGIAELVFSGFLGDLVPLGLVGALALLWRLISYYPYLFIGAIILPRWLRETRKRKRTQAANL